VPHGIILGADGEKMSKSRGNVVCPDEIVKKFGADALRMYELFLGPHEAVVSWDDKGILGISRFLERVNKFFQINNESDKDDKKVLVLLHKTIKKVTEDISEFKFNTAISALMILLNNMEGKKLSRSTKEIFLKLLNPFAPHLAEELWHNLGNKNFIQKELWPVANKKFLKEDNYDLIVQINGKHRATIAVRIGITEAEAQKLALAQERVKSFINNQKIKKVIFVPNRLINFVI